MTLSRTLHALLLGASWFAPAVLARTVTTMTPVEASSCRSAERQGRFSAIDALGADNLTCQQILTRQDEINELFLGAADLPVQTPESACFLNGFRAEVADQLEQGLVHCSGQATGLFAAGFALGRDACQLAAHSNPEAAILELREAAATPKAPFASRLIPISSSAWRGYLAAEALTGSKAGCLAGLQLFARQAPLPYLTSGPAGLDWTAAGESNGTRFKRALCGASSLAPESLAASLTMSQSGPAFSAALIGIKKGWETPCTQ